MMDKPFQRKGADSNTQVGRDFETKAEAFFAAQGIKLTRGVSIEIGVNGKKPHNFDLGDEHAKVLVECKAHTWTEGGNVPSAKMTTWNQAMFFFHAAPSGFRKILFVLKDFSEKRKETLGQYYIRTNPHLIPKDVEVWEFDEAGNTATRIK
ncbi:MAG: hypothetical protein PHT49_04585 [Desulfovibrionales bacterium]|nr:hypothetical protein [Desulfovibrionales bacterium]